MDPIGKHTLEFVRACEAIHALLAIGRLTSAEQDLIQFTSSELLRRLKPAEIPHMRRAENTQSRAEGSHMSSSQSASSE